MTADGRPMGDVTGDGLTLIPVGTGGAYSRQGEAQSCYLVRTPHHRVVFDLGSGAFNRLQAQCPPEELDAIVITHAHPDHCADLLALRVYLMIGPGRGARIRLLTPPGLVGQLAALTGPEAWDDVFAVEELREGETTLGDGLVMRAAEVPHIPPTHALRIDYDGRSVVYGADCADNEALVELARDCDVLLLECSLGPQAVPPGGPPHLGAREAAGIAARAGARRLLLTHIYPEHSREQTVTLARRHFAGPVALAVQGEGVRA